MKIRIHKTFEMAGIPSEIEIESGTLGSLLDSFVRPTYYAKEIIDSGTGDLSLDDLFQIELNGVPYYSLPDALDTELHEDDVITLRLIFFGGG
jgi:hypothetical protein